MQTYCNPCSVFRTLPTCTVNLTIGTLPVNTTGKYIYLKNHTTGVIYRFEGTTNLGGLLVIDVTDGGEFKPIPGHDYELWVTLEDASNIDERINITIDSVVYTCAAFTFEDIVGPDMALESYEDQTLKLMA